VGTRRGRRAAAQPEPRQTALDREPADPDAEREPLVAAVAVAGRRHAQVAVHGRATADADRDVALCRGDGGILGATKRNL